MTKESDLISVCLEYLAYKGFFVHRQNTGAFKTEKGFYRFGVKGGGDIIMVYGGQHIEWELKVGKNRQSKSQKEYQEKLEKAGGMYFVIHSLEELQEQLTAFGL